ncbi:hypothetical protein FRB95_006525 [Tulasnella sp. JGI-2019a]|nr:hypothetical protein FRB95_006525 [Tulasnella sp. JGI-2019a]
MAEITPVVDFSTLEREKENITANRDGHSALALQQTFSVPRNQRQQQLAATKAQFNRELERALRDSDDPLDAFVRFVQWTLDSYPSGKSSDSGLTTLLELATRTFKDDAQYKHDRRYLNLWLQYANLVAKPQLIFAHLLANDIGSVFTLLYVEYANVLERQGQRSKADEIYRLGIARKAKPASLLEERYNEFQARMLSAKPDGPPTPESESSPPTAPVIGGRKVLGENRTARQAGPSSAPQQSTAPTPRPGNAGNKGKFSVFSDADAGPSDYATNDWNKLQGEAARDKENSAGATAWQGEKLHQRGVAQTPKTPRFTVLRDDDGTGDPTPVLFKTLDAIHIRAPSEKPPTEAELLFNDPFKNWADPPSEFVNAEAGPSVPRAPSTTLSTNAMPPPPVPKGTKGKGAATAVNQPSFSSSNDKTVNWRDSKYPQPRAFVPDDEIPAVPGQPKRKPEVTYWKLNWNAAEKREYSTVEARSRHLGLLGKKWPVPPIIKFEVTKLEDGSTRSRQIPSARMSMAKEPTVTINTKFAMNDVFDMFNGEGDDDEGESFDDGDDGDGAGPSTSMATPVAAIARRGPNPIAMNTAAHAEKVPPTPTPYSRSMSASNLGEQTPSAKPKTMAATPKFAPFVDPPSSKDGLGSSTAGLNHSTLGRTVPSASGLGRSASGPAAAAPRFAPFVDPPANRIASATPKFTPFVDPPSQPATTAATPRFTPFVDPPNPGVAPATSRFTPFVDPPSSYARGPLASQAPPAQPLATRIPLATTGTRLTPAFRPFVDSDVAPPATPSPAATSGASPRLLVDEEAPAKTRPSQESLGSNNIFKDVAVPPSKDIPVQKKTSVSPPRRLSLNNIFSSETKFPVQDVFTSSVSSSSTKIPPMNTGLFPDIQFIPSPDPTEDLHHSQGNEGNLRAGVTSKDRDGGERQSEAMFEASVPLPTEQQGEQRDHDSSDEGDYETYEEHHQQEEYMEDDDGEDPESRWRFGRGPRRFDAFDEMTPITERTYEFTRTSSASDFPDVGRRSSVAARHSENELSRVAEGEEGEGFDESAAAANTSIASVTREGARRPRQSVARPRQSIAPPPDSDADTLTNPCNPFDEALMEQILMMYVDMAPFVDRRNETCGQLERLQRFGSKKLKSNADKRKSYSAGETMHLTLGEDKFLIQAKLGEGGFGAVFLAAVVDASPDLVDEDKYVALKAVKPCQIWEYTVLSRIRECLPADDLLSIITPETLYAFADESYLVIDHCPHGTLLDCVNKAVLTDWGSNGGTGMTEVLVIFFTVELFRVVDALHAHGFIHGDLKIDNCLARLSEVPGGMGAWSNRYDPSGNDGWAFFGVRLIDFGRAIDTTIFPEGQTFKGDWPTDARDCVEMREGRAWTYETDYFGLAGIIYCMLFAKYIETTTKVDPATGAVRHRITTPFKRYWNTDLWTRVFDVLLNPKLARADGELPIVDELAMLREEMENWLVQNSTKGKRSLKQMLKAMQMWD